MMNQATAVSLPTATGKLVDNGAERIVLHILESDYRLHLAVDGPLDAQVGERVRGVIRGSAKRVDVFPAGGLFIEPVFGRPRHVHGRIVGGDLQRNELHLKIGPHAAMIATLMPRQSAGDFAMGQIVGFDVERGARFELHEKA